MKKLHLQETARRLVLMPAVSILLLVAGAAHGAVQMGMHMDFVLSNGSTVRVFPEAKSSARYGLNPSWKSARQQQSNAVASQNTCDEIQEALSERAVAGLGSNDNEDDSFPGMAEVAQSGYPGWLTGTANLTSVFASHNFRSMPKPTSWYYLPTEPRLSMDKGRPEATFLKFITDEDESAGGRSGGLFHMMATMGLTRQEEAELSAALAKAVPGAKLKGAVDLELTSRGENFIVTSASLQDSEFSSGVVSSGYAPTFPGGKAALAGNMTEIGAILLEQSLNRPTADLSVTFAYQYIAKTLAYTADVTIDLSRINKVMECSQEAQTTHRKTEWKFGGWKAMFGIFAEEESEVVGVTREQLEEAYSTLISAGAVNFHSDQNLPDIDMSILEQSLMETAMSSFLDLQKSFTTSQLMDDMAMPEEDSDEEGEGDGKPNSENYRIYTVRNKLDTMQGTLTFHITKEMAVYRDHIITGNMGAEMRKYKNQIFAEVPLRDEFFQRVRIDASMGFEAIDLFAAQMVNAVSVRVVVPFANQADFEDNEVFTHQKVAGADTATTFTFAKGGATQSPSCLYRYVVVWNMRGGGKWPRNPKELCATQTLIAMEPPVELRNISVEADLDQFGTVGIPYAEVQFRYPQYGRSDTEAVKFRVSEFNAAQYIDLYVDKGTGAETQSPIEYRVVFQHEKLGTLPPSPWQKMELDNVIVNFYQLPDSYLRSVADRVEGISEYLD